MRTFLILGSSRSGTSLTAGLLHKNSINMGEQFTSPDWRNPRGFYEDLDFVNFNIRWLHEARGSFIAPPSTIALQKTATKLNAVEFLSSVVATKPTGEWGVKDPRIVWLWPWYADAFKDSNPHLIITRRNVDSTARSLANAGWAASTRHGLDIAIRFDKRLSEIVEQATWPMLELHFEQWRRDRQRQEARVEEFVGRGLDFSSVEFTC